MSGELLTLFLTEHLVCDLSRGYFELREKRKCFRLDCVLPTGEGGGGGGSIRTGSNSPS